MLKLYKRTRDGLAYWEAWFDGREITVHRGTVGSEGEFRVVRLRRGEDAESAIQRESHGPRSEGFAEPHDDDLSEIIVQFRVDGWGTVDDLETRHAIEELLDSCLGWTGNGHCEGGDIGSGTMNVNVLVLEPALAVETVTAKLAECGLLGRAVIALVSGDDYKVVFPANYEEPFSLGAGPN